MTIDVGGVGYDVAVPLSTLSTLPEDGEVFLHIQTVFRENVLELYGFIDQEGKALFEMLLGVTGVGPRLALSHTVWDISGRLYAGDAHGGFSQVHVYPGHWQEVS